MPESSIQLSGKCPKRLAAAHDDRPVAKRLSWKRRAALTCVLAIILAEPVETAAQATGGTFGTVRSLWTQARAKASEDSRASLALFDEAILSSPGNNMLVRSAATAALNASDRRRLELWIRRLAEQGGGLSADALEAVAQAIGPSFDLNLRQSLEANAVPVERSFVMATVEPEIRLVEGIAYDATTGSLFVSSVMDSAIFRIERDGTTSRISVPAGAGSPMGMTIDTGSGVLWSAIDSAGPPCNPAGSLSGLLQTSLHHFRHRFIPAPADIEAHIGDVAVGPDGTAYAADGQNGAVYFCRPGCRRLERLVEPGSLRSAQGLAVSADGQRLYASDYAYGIVVIGLEDRAMRRLETAPGVALDGIDGLVRSDDSLIGIQNGWNPARVVKIELDRSGYRAVGLEVLERGHSLHAEPTQAAPIGHEAIIYVANSQWPSYESSGLRDGSQQHPTHILRLPIESGGHHPLAPRVRGGTRSP